MIKCKWDIARYISNEYDYWDEDHADIMRWAMGGDWELLSGTYCFYAPYVKMIMEIQHAKTT